MEDKFVTVLNFECKDCGIKAGQLIHRMTKDEEREGKIKCKNCGSTNCIYSTFMS